MTVTAVPSGYPATSSSAAALSLAQIATLWLAAGGAASSAAVATAVAMAESGGHIMATDDDRNGTVDRGLWQINSVHGALSTYDPAGNAKAAIQISANGKNWTPWVTYNTGAYRQYLAAAQKAVAQVNTGPNLSNVPVVGGAVTAAQELAGIPSAISQGEKELGHIATSGGQILLGLALLGMAAFILIGPKRVLSDTAKTAKLAAVVAA